jgi:polyhydroxyalkanoate synthesis regulator phasin
VGIGMRRVSLNIEAVQLTTDELLKRMSKEQAIVFIQHLLRQMEESLNEPEVPAAKIRMEKVLEELKRS